MNRYILAGTGVAGVAAAEAIRKQDPGGSIILIGDEPSGYYSRPGLAYYLTGEIPESQLYPMSEKDFRDLKVKRMVARVTRINPQEHTISLNSGALLPYDRLLIATGASATPLKVKGSQAEGVVKLDNLEDTRRIIHLAKRARSAVVVGGGITALELVEGLVARKIKTVYLLRGDRYWSNVLDEKESVIVEHRLQEEGVEVYHQTELDEVLHDKRGRLQGVRTKDGRLLRCDILAAAIGVQPRKELAVAAGLKTERGLLVDEYLSTSHPDIFAAGDVAQVFDPLTGKTVLDSLWGPARDQGTAAGNNMTGVCAPYFKNVPFNVTRLARLTTTIIGRVGGGEDQDLLGIARGDSETWHQLPDAIVAQADFDINRLRVLVGRQSLIGAIVIGNQSLSRPLHHLISRGIDISPIRDRLLHPTAPIADTIAEFWSNLTSPLQHAAQQP